MLKSCTKKYTDESDEHVFRFTFYCDGCGKPVTAKPIAYTATPPAESAPAAERELFNITWQKAHDAAHGRADSEAYGKLFRCPSCFEIVCEGCVRAIYTPDGNIVNRCKKCMERKYELSKTAAGYKKVYG